MNRLPVAVLGAGATVGTYLALHYSINHESTGTPNQTSVEACADLLGSQAVASQVFSECKDYTDQFTPTSISSTKEGSKTITFKLPTSAEFLKNELPQAVNTDNEIESARTSHAWASEFFAVILGGVTGSVVYGGGQSLLKKRIEKKQLEARKNSDVRQTSNSLA